MRRPVAYIALAMLVGIILAATVLRNEAAQAKSLAQSVLIGNTAAAPVPVKSTLQPVQAFVFGGFPTGERFSSEETLYTVPAGKTLVIESFTVGSNMSADDRFMHAVLQFELSGFSNNFDWFVQPADEGVASTGARVFRGSMQLTAYAGPGTTVTAEAVREGPNLSGTSVSFQIAGHLIDTP